ncbi:EF-P beta-lysylation protein EpmB [Planctomicrobium piriforme]|uniref:L-lysine 2,3-aminomutase n=1 Tax=Planctomicrobium piriforme TaxID=1576369 RepID=A0A1I3S5G9_9PLAN|nr:EF-P beta-lysylation protein EpmB [Planctomicrobium piriforme]SFJ53925.1 EF-P beta-lysylation protein EpmB [Planctomicrobium piriforme]
MPGTREILPPGEAVSGEPASPDRTWQRSLANAIRDVSTLLDRLGLTGELPDFSPSISPRPSQETNRVGRGAGGEGPERLAATPASPEASNSDAAPASDFPVLVPESYLRRMRAGDPRDPLLLQVLPVTAEQQNTTGFGLDPVGDEQARLAPGLLHKYHGRALLIAHGSCAVHCRYCFRRHFPYAEEPHSHSQFQPALDALRADESISEIILSGGDPLILSNRRLRQLLASLEEIPHLRRLRIHSRLPIVLPDRINTELLQLLTSSRLRTIFVVHANHARELTGDCADALSQIRESGIPVLNQAVLLRGVNDSVDALADLCERCVDLGVMPYYLHQLDRVQGAAHFEVPVEVGRELITALQARLPGYAVPRYVAEYPGAPSKTPLRF